jgi:hypothetical protein
MAITASPVTTNNSLEQFRQQFNNLQSDVRGLESGTLSFSTITTTTTNATTVNVLEDGVIVFEGATDDANETTLGAVDPTADRTINLPNESGTVLLKDTTENTFITGQTSISSGDIASASDELLISDADASSFKRVTVDNLISSAGGLTAVSADSTPQLGGDLDTNNNDIVTVSNRNLNLLPNGTGLVVMDGNGSSGGVSVSDGLIDIRTGTGNVAKIKFYCESSNAHAQTLQAAPHSSASSAVLVLPTASGTLIGTGDTGTLPLAAIDIDGGTDIGEALTTSDLIVVDNGAGGTNRKSALSRMVTLMAANLDDPTALAIALG